MIIGKIIGSLAHKGMQLNADGFFSHLRFRCGYNQCGFINEKIVKK